MKTSRYNLYIKTGNNSQFILYNTLIGSISVIDGEIKDALKSGCLGILKEKHLDALKEHGYIIEDDVNEETRYEFKVKSRIFNPMEYEFCVLLTYDCNLSCTYCDAGAHEGQTMDDSTADNIISFIKRQTTESRRKYVNVRVFGGEPLVHPELVLRILKDVSEWSISNNINFNGALITNGTLLSTGMITTLSPYLSVVQLTLEGSREHHDKIRKFKDGSGTYDKIMDAVRLLQDSGVMVFLRLHVSPGNSGDMETLFSDLARSGFKNHKIGISIYPVIEGSNICSFYPLPCAAGENNVELLSEAWNTAIENGFNVVTKPLSNHVILSCPFTSNYSVIIDPPGNIYKCLRFAGREDKRVARAGEDGNFSDVNYELFDFMSRNASCLYPCRSCAYLPLCNGGCAYTAFTKNSGYHRPYCGSSKELARKKISAYLKQSTQSTGGGGASSSSFTRLKTRSRMKLRSKAVSDAAR